MEKSGQARSEDTSVEGESILLYDGICVLCNTTVGFFLKADRDARFKFGSLQGETAESWLAQRPDIRAHALKSVILIENFGADAERVFFSSDAILTAVSQLGGLWKLASILRLIPKFIRDGIYNFIARNRYRWFGKYDACPLPPPEHRNRFVP